MTMNIKLKIDKISKAKKFRFVIASCLLATGVFFLGSFDDTPKEALAIVLKKESTLIERKYAELLFSNTCKISSKKQGDVVVEALYNAALTHRVDFELLLAVMSTESNCRQNAISPKGAMGLMQLTPDTAKWLGANNPMNVNQNINAGAKYLAYLLKEFDGNFNFALAAYNAGPNAVKKYKAIPPYRETKGYVKGVLSKYIKYGDYVKLTKI